MTYRNAELNMRTAFGNQIEWSCVKEKNIGGNTMSETVKIWFTNELEQVNGAISNERLWSKGADDAEQAFMHEQNMDTLIEYRQLLEEALRKIR